MVRFSVGAKDFSVVQTYSGAHSAPTGWVRRFFLGRLNGRDVKVTIHLHLPRLRVSGAISPPPSPLIRVSPHLIFIQRPHSATFPYDSYRFRHNCIQ